MRIYFSRRRWSPVLLGLGTFLLLLSGCVSTTQIKNAPFNAEQFDQAKAYLVATNSTIWKPGPALTMQSAIVFRQGDKTIPLVSNENDDLIVLPVEPGLIKSDLALYAWDLFYWRKVGTYGSSTRDLEFQAQAGHFYYIGDFGSRKANFSMESSLAAKAFANQFRFPLEAPIKTSFSLTAGGQGASASPSDLVGHRYTAKKGDQVVGYQFDADGTLHYFKNDQESLGKWTFDGNKVLLRYTLDWTEGETKKGYLANVNLTKSGIAINGYWYLTDAFITLDQVLDLQP